MEGGAKGQVGGMEMGEAERKRLAEESRGWRCQGCGGRSNEEVLQEQEGEAQKEGKGESKEEVPEELKFGFRDEMQKIKEAKESQEGSSGEATEATSKGVITAIPFATAEWGASALPPNPALSTASSPTMNTRLSQPLQPPGNQPQRTPTSQMSTPETVPGWVDKAIAGLVASLGVMIIKKLMA